MAQVMGILLVEDRNTYTHTYGLSSICHVSANDDLVMLAIKEPYWYEIFILEYFNLSTRMIKLFF